jgi:hypothetical protein
MRPELMDMQPRFFARGNAVAFAGRVTRLDERKVDQPIDVPNNSVALPVTGGISHAETGRHALLHDHTWPAPLVTFAEGVTRAWDDERDAERLTHVMASLDEFSIAGRFFIERAAAYLRSSYKPRSEEPDIVIVEPMITRMRCDEYVVDVRWHVDVFNKVPTFAALEKAWARSKPDDALNRRVLRPRTSKKPDPKALPAMKGHVLVSICELAWADRPHPDVTLDGHVLRWPGFGTVYVGEMLISHHLRRLTLLRFALGSPFAMNGSGIEVESDGIGLP